MKTYLTENNLFTLLCVLFDPTKIHRQFKIKNDLAFSLYSEFKLNHFRVDFFLDLEKPTIVEFDGYRHFTETKTQMRDFLLKEFCKNHSVHLVSIPYFIQPNGILFQNLFNVTFPETFIDHGSKKAFSSFIKEQVNDLDWDFPHGFISPKCVRPADFNIWGWNLFIEFYFKLTSFDHFSIAQDIYSSLTKNDNFLTEWFPQNMTFFTPERFIEQYPT